jgi:hypothetical protein
MKWKHISPITIDDRTFYIAHWIVRYIFLRLAEPIEIDGKVRQEKG